MAQIKTIRCSVEREEARRRRFGVEGSGLKVKSSGCRFGLQGLGIGQHQGGWASSLVAIPDPSHDFEVPW